MGAKVSVFIATSLDGFIARKDGALDWLDRANATVSAGEGTPLFGELAEDVALVHVGTKAFNFGFVQPRYRVAKTKK